MMQRKKYLAFIVQCTYIWFIAGREISLYRRGRVLTAWMRFHQRAKTMFTNIEDFQKFNKEQMEAATAAVATFSKGVQQIAAETTDYSKKSIEHSSAVFEKLMAAKTLDNAFQIQSDYAKTAYEGLVAQATKMGELYTNLAKEAFRPIEGAFAKVQASAK
jgi:phasin family protein